MKNTSKIFAAGQVLTLEVAKSLKGKKIATTHPVYKANKATVTEFVVGEIISEWDLAAKNIDAANFPQGNQQLYWASYMSEDRINEAKTTLVLLAADGTNNYIRCHTDSGYFDEPTFTCSDADREVYYVEVVTAKKSVEWKSPHNDKYVVIEGQSYQVVGYRKQHDDLGVICEAGTPHYLGRDVFDF